MGKHFAKWDAAHSTLSSDPNRTFNVEHNDALWVLPGEQRVRVAQMGTEQINAAIAEIQRTGQRTEYLKLFQLELALRQPDPAPCGHCGERCPTLGMNYCSLRCAQFARATSWPLP